MKYGIKLESMKLSVFRVWDHTRSNMVWIELDIAFNPDCIDTFLMWYCKGRWRQSLQYSVVQTTKIYK